MAVLNGRDFCNNANIILCGQENLPVNDVVKDIIERIKDYNPDFDVYIAGGYLRDLYCGKEFYSDVDIFLSPKDNAKRTVVIPAEYQADDNFNFDASGNTDLSYRGIGEIKAFKVHYLGGGFPVDAEVQLIMYNRPMSVKEICFDMDYNVNQIVYDTHFHKTFVSSAFKEAFDKKILVNLHDYDIKRKFERASRMAAKFPDFEHFDVEQIYPLMDYPKSPVNYYDGYEDDLSLYGFYLTMLSSLSKSVESDLLMNTDCMGQADYDALIPKKFRKKVHNIRRRSGASFV
ncbi:hypothetical protein [Pseudoalteromonas phage J2-1_QLiu-2017]|nr:hypothetical protein [Pseudoalteromonas phage J2-1_QLiu-2017]